MAKIILTRKRDFIHWFNRYTVYIDGQNKGTIKSGASEEYEVGEGQHTVRCTLSWYSSNHYTVNLGATDVKFILVRNNQRFYWVLYLLLLVVLVLPLLMPERVADFRYLTYAALGLVFAYGLYYAVFARNKSLIISEDRENIFAT
ncbi:MAG TPA: hypothetical protein VF145_01720 [Chitinophagaceae bacterium]